MESASETITFVAVKWYRRWLVNVCFIVIGMGSSIGWFTISFAISFFLKSFDSLQIHEYSWSIFLLCYNLPGLPIQIFQYFRANQTNEEKKTYLHSVLHYALLTIILLAFPMPFFFFDNVEFTFIVNSILVLGVGVIQAILFGKIFQLASLYDHSVFATIPSCMAGLGLSTFFILFITLTERFDINEYASPEHLLFYFLPNALVPLVSIVALVYVILNGDLELKYDTKEDMFVEMIGDDKEASFVEMVTQTNSSVSESESEEVEEISSVTFSHIHLLKEIGICGFATFSLGFGFVTLAASVPYLRESTDDEKFDSIVIYLQAIFYFMGNEAAALVQCIRSVNSLLFWTFFQFFIFVPIIWNSWYASLDSMNIILYLFVVFYAFLTAYLNSCSYVIASTSVHHAEKTTAVALLNIFLYLGYTCGLGISFALPFAT